MSARFKAIFEKAPNAIIIADDARCCIAANPAARRLTGTTKKRLHQLRLDDFVAEADRETFEIGWETFLRTGHKQGEFKLSRPDGQIRIIEYRAQANMLPGQHLATCHDVTEAREAHRNRNQHLAVVAHELKNPLNVVLLASQILLGPPPAWSQCRDEAERIFRAARRMTELITCLSG